MSTRWHGLDRVMPRLARWIDPVVRKYGGIVPHFRLREEAAAISAAVFGPDMRGVDAINVTMLGLLSNALPATWLCRPSASRVIMETDLRSIPSLPPRLLRHPGIVETRRPETGERLFGDVASLGWYSLGERYWLVGLCYPDGFAVARWDPQWTGEELAAQLPAPDRTAILSEDQRTEHQRFAEDAARYLVTLGLLAEVEEGPLRIVLDTSRRERKVRDVYLGPGALSDPPRERHEPLVKLLDGFAPEARPIRGHLKKQRFGPRLSEQKWIYVRGFSARRWMRPRWFVSEAGSGEIEE